MVGRGEPKSWDTSKPHLSAHSSGHVITCADRCAERSNMNFSVRACACVCLGHLVLSARCWWSMLRWVWQQLMNMCVMKAEVVSD